MSKILITGVGGLLGSRLADWIIDNTDNELYVIIRYKGDPSPVTSITLSYS